MSRAGSNGWAKLRIAPDSRLCVSVSGEKPRSIIWRTATGRLSVAPAAMTNAMSAITSMFR